MQTFLEAFGKEENDLPLFRVWSRWLTRTLVKEIHSVRVAEVEGLKKSIMEVCLSPCLGEMESNLAMVGLWSGLGLIPGSWQLALAR